MQIHDRFEVMLDPRWKVTQVGQGSVVRRPGSVHFTLLPNDDSTYHNAQITDYTPDKKEFQFKPPLKMQIKAYSSLHPNNLVGTAGFGFWNHALEPGKFLSGRPQALWFFFGAPPHNIALAKDVPGDGWKAATIDTKRWQFAVLAPLAPLGMLMMRVKTLYNALWGIAQQSMAVTEAVLDKNLLNMEHVYTLEWRTDGATFKVNDKVVHETNTVPQNSLGFIAWMDNQYMIATPQGYFKSGLSAIKQPQALVLSEILIEPL
jgi:hypothetical protein